MEEIEVGDYVRTEWGITQVKKITIEPEVDIGIAIMPEVAALWTSESEYFEAKDIYKRSKNIIDLIEVGDYVNGKLVSNIDKVDNMNFIEWDDGDMYKTEILNDKFIKSIVTKEAFANAEYRVEIN